MTKVATAAKHSRRSGGAAAVPSESPVVDIPPLPLHPDLSDIIRRMDSLHECLHTGQKEAREGMEKIHTRISAVKDDVMNVRERLSFLEGATQGTAARLGVKVEARPSKEGEPDLAPSLVRPTLLATLTWPKAIFAGAATVGGSIAAYRLLAAVWEPTMKWLGAIHQAAMTVQT